MPSGRSSRSRCSGTARPASRSARSLALLRRRTCRADHSPSGAAASDPQATNGPMGLGAADPQSANEPAVAAGRPVRLVVTNDLGRGRLGVLFRALLALPFLI